MLNTKETAEFVLRSAAHMIDIQDQSATSEMVGGKDVESE